MNYYARLKSISKIIDMENWMSNLPQNLRKLPIIHLAIPGSHDSGTAAITYHCKVSPDAEAFLQQIKFLGPVLRGIMARWSKTQGLNLLEQLKAGIRYFDFRVATKENCPNCYFVHGLYAENIEDKLHDLKKFLSTHPKEVVIIDFQHFYAFRNEDHNKLMQYITSTFKGKLIPYLNDMENISLSYMEKYGYQLFAIYRSQHAWEDQPLLWPSCHFPTPWPETVSLPELITKLNQGLVTRSSNLAYVSQFVLTPTSWFVSKHLFSTLQKQCVTPFQKAKLEWLQKQRNGPNGVNIIISDFIETNSNEFTKEEEK